MKRCSKCKEYKNLKEFHKDKNKKIGVVSQCKGCCKETEKRKYKKLKENPEKYKKCLERKWQRLKENPEKYKLVMKKQLERRKNWVKINPEKNSYYYYRHSAKERNYNFDLTKKEFISFWRKPCHYCGDAIETIGLDRVDNKKGYSMNNVVPCCKDCNTMKLTKTREEFIIKCKKISKLSI